MSEFRVTPWEVKGEVDYERLMREFGTEPITDELIERLKKHTGDIHYMLRRGIFFSHRDLDWILEKYEQGEEFVLYTGRGPSGHTHLGHMVPWVFTKYLQDRFDAELYFQLTDDEKFLHEQKLKFEEAKGFAYENALDIIAMGFKEGKTHLIIDTDSPSEVYELAVRVSKHVTFSMVRAIFGFEHSTNVGMLFFPCVQAAISFLPSLLKGRNVPCLIPAAIDQDPYWRGIARYVAPKLGFYKPAQIHSKFMPGLGKGGKMSSSEPETAIFTTDEPERVRRKIMNAFTGGRDTVKEQRALGGRPDICPVFKYYEFLFERDDERLKEIYDDCKGGGLLCGECKARLIERINRFLEEHRRRRKRAEGLLERFVMS